MTISLHPHDIGCEPSPSTPAETLIQDGWSTHLLFYAVSKDSEGLPHRELGVAVVECEGCSVTKFGYPNDEGLPEHPAYALGLGEASTSVFEMRASPWVKEHEAQIKASKARIWGGRGANSFASPQVRHFVVLLKEATFECLPHNLSVRRIEPTFANAMEYVRSVLSER